MSEDYLESTAENTTSGTCYREQEGNEGKDSLGKENYSYKFNNKNITIEKPSDDGKIYNLNNYSKNKDLNINSIASEHVKDDQFDIKSKILDQPLLLILVLKVKNPSTTLKIKMEEDRLIKKVNEYLGNDTIVGIRYIY